MFVLVLYNYAGRESFLRDVRRFKVLEFPDDGNIPVRVPSNEKQGEAVVELLGDTQLLTDFLQDGVGLLDVLNVDAYSVFVHEEDLEADVFEGLPPGLLLRHE